MPSISRRDLLCSGLALSASSIMLRMAWGQSEAPLAGVSDNVSAAATAAVAPREQLLFDFGWKFTFGNGNDPSKDLGFGYSQSDFAKTGDFKFAKAGFDDSKWRSLNLPHDWAVELPFVWDEEQKSHGYKPLGRRYPEPDHPYRNAFQRDRDRIIHARAFRRLEATREFADEMYFCLGCLACMTACPAGVNYAELFEQSRAEAEDKKLIESPRRSLIRAFTLRWLFMEHSRLQFVGRILGLYQRLGLQTFIRRSGILKLLPKRLRELEAMTPTVQPRFSEELINPVTPAVGERKYKVAVLTGWELYLLLASAVVGLALGQSALRAGALAAAMAASYAVTLLSSVALGLAVFGESFGHGGGRLAIAAAGLVLALAGVVLLARTPVPERGPAPAGVTPPAA